MKNKLTGRSTLWIWLLLIAISCDNDDEPTPIEITISPLQVTIAENPQNGDLLGELNATTNRGTLAFSLTNENPIGAMVIDASTGNVNIADASLFDYESNTTISAVGNVTTEGEVATANITITLTDVDESTLSAQDFTVTIDENPINGQVLGNITATADASSAITYSITSQTPSGAMAIDATTGQLTVADSTLFDYESNTSLTADISVKTATKSEDVTATISLNDLSEITISVNDFTVTVDENIANGTVIGTVDASVTNSTGTLTYTIVNQSVNGALAINANTGELTVADASAFDYETNTSITGTYKASTGTIEEEGSITINLNDVVETGNGTEFALTFRIANANESITIPVNAFEYTYDYTVDWGDGNTDSNLTDNVTHTYASAGDYQVLISGTFPAIFFNFSSSEVDETRSRLISIDQWGTNQWQTMKGAFADCDQVTLKAVDNPDLSQVADISSMFRAAFLFNGNINDWDVSNVTNFGSLFSGANTFDQPLDKWDMSKATRTVSMFRGAIAFNQDINSWDVSNVEEMSNMFQSASSFNQPLSSWDVSNVHSMDGMFNEASAFNQPLNNWDVSQVEIMDRMFRRANAFNQDLNDWDMSGVLSIIGMFQVNTGFNGAIGDWDVSNVVNMSAVFSQASFNQDISGWDVSSVTNMSFMFSMARQFNQDISGWDVSNVRNMMAMFQRTPFNQDIGNWNVSSVTNMSSMFGSNTVFNRDLTGWEVNRVTNCSNFRQAAALRIENIPNFTNCTQ